MPVPVDRNEGYRPDRKDYHQDQDHEQKGDLLPARKRYGILHYIALMASLVLDLDLHRVVPLIRIFMLYQRRIHPSGIAAVSEINEIVSHTHTIGGSS